MPLHFDGFKNNVPKGHNGDVNIDSLEVFRKALEKNFFSDVSITNFSNPRASTHLSLELKCNLSLIEMLFHYNKGNWGYFGQSNLWFAQLFTQLQDSNIVPLDIEEFTLFLKDTTIVINKIYCQSITDQLHNILNKIGEHYVHFSKGLTETPYEIYIPVFEECTDANDTLIQNIEAGNQTVEDYFKYWGLYCDSEEDAVIYDLKNSRIEQGDLFMLNQ